MVSTWWGDCESPRSSDAKRGGDEPLPSRGVMSLMLVGGTLITRGHGFDMVSMYDSQSPSILDVEHTA